MGHIDESPAEWDGRAFGETVQARRLNNSPDTQSPNQTQCRNCGAVDPPRRGSNPFEGVPMIGRRSWEVGK